MEIDGIVSSVALRDSSEQHRPGRGSKTVTDPITSDTISRAKTLVYRGNNPGSARALNLILMAETALKNGNPDAAAEFAWRAIDLMNPEPELIRKTSGRVQEPETGRKSRFVPAVKHRTASRVYHDVSHDPGVSFKYASPLTGPQSFIAVPAHEGEHVGLRVGEATFRGENIIVIVSYDVRYDPETGEAYIAGGLTRTVRLTEGYRATGIESGGKIDT
jgi:hypothetical protein